MKMKERKGSALLIVLGMLAFMIVSAVAFSAYMRYARLPSSYLRRTTASRELTKAAIARAIDELDFAIANNPYPGLGVYDAKTGGNRQGSHRNYFKNHVFVGTNELFAADYGYANTTPVLSLEGLAYVPPPLINDVRYFSRRSPTAAWKKFDFDAGRYAYCAVDVSDYFDVNRVRADVPRSSASCSRISLAYLFENQAHTSSGSTMSKWDNDIDSATGCVYDENTHSRNFLSGVPLVSIADMNLALKDVQYGEMFCPWYKYIKSGKSNNGFYGTTTPQTLAESVGRMTFVTDGYFPRNDDSLSEDDKDFDLSNPDFQPFKMDDLKRQNPQLLSVIDYTSNTKSITRLFESLCGLGLCSLWDYLDPDSNPLSLAIPTTERVPMVCGIKPQIGECKVKIVRSETEQNEEPASGPGNGVVWHHKRVYEFKIDGTSFAQGIMGGSIKPMVVYPFCRDDGAEEESFKMDGHFGIYFTSGGAASIRTSGSDVLHFGAYKDITQPKLENGVIMVPFGQSESFNFKASSINDEKDAVDDTKTCSLAAGASYIAPTFNGNAFVTVTYEWDQESERDGMGGYVWKSDQSYPQEMPPSEKMTAAHCNMPPLNADGTPDTDVSTDAKFMDVLKGSGKTITLNFAVWIGIKNNEGKYVDLVPACLKDDDDLNNSKNFQFMGPTGNNIAGRPYPLLRFETGVSLDLSITSLNESSTSNPDGIAVSLSPSQIVVSDPRYNHIPEDWYEPEWDMTADNWIENDVHKKTPDLFMNTSDQGYLQSPYELAFLPRLTNMRSFGANQHVGDFAAPDDGRTKLSNGQKGEGQALHNNLMWKTYDPLDVDRESFETLGFTANATGIKVNPYSSNTNVIMAAFANTPLDWRCASTNDTGYGEEIVKMKASDFNAKYAWNEYSSGAKIKYADLVKVAGAFMNKISNDRSDTSTYTETRMKDYMLSQSDWKQAWCEMGWSSDTEETLAGVRLEGTDPIWEIDRKFLYGYWRECFESRQQLFLVFVRAEPTMMGGGTLNSIPPQLGGRAVALVWRDPTATPESEVRGGVHGYPHRTRILFYKTLE